MRAAIYIAVIIIYCITYHYGTIVIPALAETLTCSTWHGIQDLSGQPRLHQPRNRMAGHDVRQR